MVAAKEKTIWPPGGPSLLVFVFTWHWGAAPRSDALLGCSETGPGSPAEPPARTELSQVLFPTRR